MALRISLKPHEKMILGGAVIANDNNAACHLIIKNRVPILREKDILSEEEANSPSRRLYFVIQLMYILIHKSSKGNDPTKKSIYELYLKNTRFVNNWDLVDASAEHIVGAFLMDKSKKPLYRLAKSKNLWERRISIMSTFYFIKRNEFSETLKIAKMLISDKEDLVHKAVGWMLREVGKRHLETEEKFLEDHYKKMPRTMLRYAIERFPEPKRQRYLKGKI